MSWMNMHLNENGTFNTNWVHQRNDQKTQYITHFTREQLRLISWTHTCIQMHTIQWERWWQTTIIINNQSIWSSPLHSHSHLHLHYMIIYGLIEDFTLFEQTYLTDVSIIIIHGVWFVWHVLCKYIYIHKQAQILSCGYHCHAQCILNCRINCKIAHHVTIWQNEFSLLLQPSDRDFVLALFRWYIGW